MRRFADSPQIKMTTPPDTPRRAHTQGPDVTEEGAAFIHPSACIDRKVHLERGVSLWPTRWCAVRAVR